MLDIDCGTPEGLFVLNPSTPPGIPVDAMLCIVKRASSVVLLLESHMEQDGERLSEVEIGNVLWSLRGDLGMLRTLIDFAWDSEKTKRKQKTSDALHIDVVGQPEARGAGQ